MPQGPGARRAAAYRAAEAGGQGVVGDRASVEVALPPRSSGLGSFRTSRRPSVIVASAS